MALWTDYPGLRFYWADIQVAAKAHQLDPLLVAAVVLQESAANTDGFRHERLFWNRYLKSRPEWASLNPRRVSSSYGLMQVMFSTAIEHGYPKDQPPELLFRPEIGLEYGCRVLRRMMDRIDAKYATKPGQDRLRAALASYNGGFQGPDALRPDNRAYAESVLRRYAALQAEHAPQA
jgi:soluble lytic murein transglycosylase-like protein